MSYDIDISFRKFLRITKRISIQMYCDKNTCKLFISMLETKRFSMYARYMEGHGKGHYKHLI